MRQKKKTLLKYQIDLHLCLMSFSILFLFVWFFFFISCNIYSSSHKACHIFPLSVPVSVLIHIVNSNQSPLHMYSSYAFCYDNNSLDWLASVIPPLYQAIHACHYFWSALRFLPKPSRCWQQHIPFSASRHPALGHLPVWVKHMAERSPHLSLSRLPNCREALCALAILDQELVKLVIGILKGLDDDQHTGSLIAFTANTANCRQAADHALATPKRIEHNNATSIKLSTRRPLLTFCHLGVGYPVWLVHS